MTKARSYCFTLNNYSEEDLPGLLELTDISKYIIWGYEQGENSTPHLQGYVQFANPVSFNTPVKYLSRAHIERAKGNPEQNILYCSKGGDFIEFGDKPCKGGSKRIKTTEQIMEELNDPMQHLSTVRYYSKAIQIARQMEIEQSETRTEYYICKEDKVDPVQIILDYFHEPEEEYPRNWHIVENMSELASIKDPDYIILTVSAMCDLPSPMTPNYWRMGKPIRYKHGYEWYVIRPKILVICTSDPYTSHPGYTRI